MHVCIRFYNLIKYFSCFTISLCMRTHTSVDGCGPSGYVQACALKKNQYIPILVSYFWAHCAALLICVGFWFWASIVQLSTGVIERCPRAPSHNAAAGYLGCINTARHCYRYSGQRTSFKQIINLQSRVINPIIIYKCASYMSMSSLEIIFSFFYVF